MQLGNLVRSTAAGAAVVAVVAVLLLLLTFRPVVLLVPFAGVLFAVLLEGCASLLRRRTRLSHRAAFWLVLAGLLALVVATGVFLAPRAAEQGRQLAEELPSAVDAARGFLDQSSVGRQALDLAAGLDLTSAIDQGAIARAGSSLLSFLGSGVIILIFGTFLAAAPKRYVGGLLLLFPSQRQDAVREVLANAHRGLLWWLLARLSCMALVGVGFWLGLALLGIPFALPLGLLAGGLSFIPYLGPTLALLPALLIGLAQGPQDALYVLLLYLGVQGVETTLVEPLVEARAVRVPPALILFAQLVAGVWAGALGVLVATPLMVVVLIVVQVLYVRRLRGREHQMAGPQRGS